MKYLTILCLIVAIGCAHERKPSSEATTYLAKDAILSGKIKATAIKTFENQEVCFNIDLTMMDVNQIQAEASNWTLAWVDQKDHYHLVSLNQRNPASAAQDHRVASQYGEYHEWTNSFKTCAPGARMSDVKSLVLTPKSLPFGKADELYLEWTK